jgi:hypothetical protein
MSTGEAMHTGDALSVEVRVFLAAYLKHLSRVDDPTYQEELTRLNQEIDAGKRFTLDQVRRMDRAVQNSLKRGSAVSSTRRLTSFDLALRFLRLLLFLSQKATKETKNPGIERGLPTGLSRRFC